MKKNQGFTLMDLLIIIAIAGILGAIFITGSMREKSESELCLGYENATLRSLPIKCLKYYGLAPLNY